MRFVEHALAFYERHGIVIRAILSDNAWSYSRNRALRELLSREGIERRARQLEAPRRSPRSTSSWGTQR